MIVIENVRLLSRGIQFTDKKIIVDQNKIREIIPATQSVSDVNCQRIDARNLFATAGFIDLHLHGDSDLPVAEQDALLDRILKFQAERGVTGIYPSQIPLPKNDFENLRLMRAKADAPPAQGAKILGIHLEGPFLNPEMRGGFSASSLIPPSLPLLKYWQQLTGDRVVRMTLSPEVPGNLEILKYLNSENILVSLGHTNASPEIMRQFFAHGARQITHFLNAMKPFHHREPGPVGAILDQPGFLLEIIPDGYHLNELTVKLILNLPHPIALVSDSTYVFYLEPGTYEYLDQTIIWDGKKQISTSGTLVGSSLTLNQAVIKSWQFSGRPLEEIVPHANEIPAQAMGLTTKGVLEPGFDADVVVFDQTGQVWLVLVEGRVVVNRLSEL
jgi:N-acetylglucosamine-6-phosphate deacetylase